MKPGRIGLHAFAIFAILFLLGFGFVIYAVPGVEATSSPASGTAQADSSSTTASDSQSNEVYYHLVQVSASAAGANASGYAGISITGQSLSLEWSVTGAHPGEQLQLVMQTASSAGATRSFTFSTVEVSSGGAAGSSGAATLDTGYYYIGLIVVDPSITSHATIFVSDPASIEVAIASSSITQTTTAIGNSLSYSLLPLPVYLHQTAPDNFSFREGGALIVASGDQLQLTTSFLGSAGVSFYNVIQTAGRNITVGKVTTTSRGGGVFRGNVTLEPGTYQVGILLYVAGNTSSPVAVSVPRSIEVTLPVTSTAGTTTTTSSSTISSTSRTTSESSSNHYTGSSTTSSRSSNSESSQGTNQLTFSPITSSATTSGYLYGQGGGAYVVTGGNIYFSLAFTGQNPSTHYSVDLSVNGSARTIGDYTTNSNGEGSVGASSTLGTGRFALALTIVDASTFSQPTAVLASVPATFTVSAHGSQTTTTTSQATTSSFLVTPPTKGPEWTFKLEPAVVQNVPKGYRFASSGAAAVSLDMHYSLLNVALGFQNANPSTTYTASVVLNGTSVNLGTMTTNKEGGTFLQSSIQVTPGTYLIGILVYDVSDITAFRADGPVLVMVSDPNSQLAVMSAPAGESSTTSTGSTQSSATVTSTVTKTVTTISAGTDVEAQIQSAVNNLTIPATIQVTPLSSSTSVLDSRFSLSVGQQVGNGLVIAISGENVTGPRVLLINMSRTDPLALYPALNITLDGAPVVEASSALQVLNPSPGDPAMYVLVATSTSIQLLVSIPHFSLHLIQVAGVIVRNIQAALELDAPLLAGSILVITIAFAGAYAARKRYFSVLV